MLLGNAECVHHCGGDTSTFVASCFFFTAQSTKCYGRTHRFSSDTLCKIGSRVVFSELPKCTWGYFSFEVKVFFFFFPPTKSWTVFVFRIQRVAVSILGPKAAYLGVVLFRQPIWKKTDVSCCNNNLSLDWSDWGRAAMSTVRIAGCFWNTAPINNCTVNIRHVTFLWQYQTEVQVHIVEW